MTGFVRPKETDANAVVSVFRVPSEVAGQRVDVFLQHELRRTSRTRAQSIVRASAYDADGRRLKPGDRVHSQQHVLLWREPWDETPVPRDIPIVYEDDHILAVNKPANLPVHPTARYHKNTVIKMLAAERNDAFLSLGHRLDRETSGVLLLTKTVECDRSLKKMLEARDGITKRYEAITWGIPAVPETGERLRQGDPYRLERQMRLDDLCEYKVKMKLVAEDDPNGLYSSTVFTVLDTIATPQGDYARVSCLIETGRQHQIRLHLQSMGAAIVGDKLYGPDDSAFARGADGELTDEDVAMLELPRHALHAAMMGLSHPITGEPLEIVAPVPDDMTEFWASLT
jgi:23S rRNA pseudouridine1911/1915/1917 synthase